MTAPRIDNGKSPDDVLNANLLFWLPPDTPYGNFQLKYMKLITRIDELNRRLQEAWALWAALHQAKGMVPPGLYERHVFVLEQCVFLMRRVADELISLVHCLDVWEATRAFPMVIKLDCIARLQHAGAGNRPAVFEPHMEVLATLNDVSNAYKHSFINSDHTLIGANEPCIHALGLKNNKLDEGAKFYNVACAGLVAGFDKFNADALAWLRAFSEKHRPQG